MPTSPKAQGSSSGIWLFLLLIGLTVSSSQAQTTYYGDAQFPTFEMIRAEYRDLDGDGDRFPDSGERGRVRLQFHYHGPSLADAVLVMSTGDPDVSCLEQWSLNLGPLAKGTTLWVGSLDPGAPGFTFRMSRNVQTVNPADPPRVDFCLRIVASEFMTPLTPGWTGPVCFPLLADLDHPAAPRSFVAGPDGQSGTADDGTLAEGFDVDRDGDGFYTINDAFRSMDAGTGTVDHAFYQRGGPPAAPGAIGGVACGGFITFEEGNAACGLDPDFPMDWHLHCQPGSTLCPNLETGTCVGGCSYLTPAGGELSLSAPNSLHMGAHFSLTDNSHNTTHLRTLQAFVTAPINLTPSPRPGDLEFSMFHIAALMDDNGVGGPPNRGQCYDCGDVQVQVDTDPDPAADAWGPWDKLVPYQNVYDHNVAAWSATGGPSPPLNCLFTPTDTGTSPPAPRGIHETMCNKQGAWSACGTTTTSRPFDLFKRNCATTGRPGQGTGLWVETRFNLDRFLGQRIRVRWIGASWVYRSYSTYLDTIFQNSRQDDGWWLDDLTFAGVTAAQSPPEPDLGEPPPGSCPGTLCTDADGDGFSASGSPPCAADARPDCDDGNPLTHPGAGESNDGLDNQCPGDAGDGLVDEVSHLELTDFPDFVPAPYLCLDFDLQFRGDGYQIVRSDRPTFPAPCQVYDYAYSCLENEPDPPPGEAFYYLVRATFPYTGSWGADSYGNERQGICGL